MATRRHETYKAGELIDVRDVEVPFEETAHSLLMSRAHQALEANRAFLNVPAPTNAQTVVQVKALTRQNQGIIRLILNQFDGTD